MDITVYLSTFGIVTPTPTSQIKTGASHEGSCGTPSSFASRQNLKIFYLTWKNPLHLVVVSQATLSVHLNRLMGLNY